MKQLYSFNYKEISAFSSRDQDFVDEQSLIQPLLPYSSNLWDALNQSLEKRKKIPVDREILVEVIKEQYASFKRIDAVEENINLLLNAHTFTVTTAHQPVIFLGPMYVIYKALSAIKIAQQLKDRNPEHDFVPVFVVGGEDHDFEEISKIQLFQKEFQWRFDAHGQPVGSLPTQSLAPLIEELQSFFENDGKGGALLASMSRIYSKNNHLTRSTQEILHLLLGKLGLVTLDMNDRRFKEIFIPFIENEIFRQESEALVLEQQKKIQHLGFKPQAFPRPINFFYLSDAGRKRIVQREETFEVLDTNLRFSQAALKDNIHSFPERFSPNVIMRPIYQSVILPDIAYVGGGGELAYWTERVTQFNEFDVHFPILLRRASLALMSASSNKKWSKLGFTSRDLAEKYEVLVKQYLKDQQDFEVSEEIAILSDMFDSMAKKIEKIDASLNGKLRSIEASLNKQLNGIEKRVSSSLKNNHDSSLNKILKIKNEVHPDHGLQERRDNLLNFYSRLQGDFIEELMKHINPYPSRFELLQFNT